MPIFHKIWRILVGMYLLCLRSPRCDFELIFIVYLVGDVAARHPSPRVHQLGDPSNSIWSYSRKYNWTRYEQINLHWLCTPFPYQKQITLSPCLSPLDFWNIECHSIFFQFRNIKFKKLENQFDFEIDFCRLHRQ